MKNTQKDLKHNPISSDIAFINKVKERNANRYQLRTYKRLALDILLKLDEKGWSQKKLAEELGVSSQYVNKLVKGNEKFGGEILCKIEEVLDLPIFIQNLPSETKKLIKEDKPKSSYTKTYEGKIIPLFANSNNIPQYATM